MSADGPNRTTTATATTTDEATAPTETVVDWDRDPTQQPMGEDGVTRRPPRLTAGVALLAALVVGGLLAVTLGLVGSFVAGVVTAGLFVGTFWALTREVSWAVVVGTVGLVPSSLAFLGALGLAFRASFDPLAVVVSGALVVGLVAVALELGVGLNAALRRRVTATLLSGSLAFGVGFVVTLALGSPAVQSFVADQMGLFGSFTTDPETGFGPAGLLALELVTLLVSLDLLRREVPATVVPPAIRGPVARGSLLDRLGLHGGLLAYGLSWLAAVVFLLWGLGAEPPVVVDAFSAVGVTLTRAVSGLVYALGRTQMLHVLALSTLSLLALTVAASQVRRRLLLDPGRRSVSVSTFGYVLVLTVVTTATPVAEEAIEPTLSSLAAQSGVGELVYALYQLLGPSTLLLVGSYLGVLVIGGVLYGVFVLEALRVVPESASGLALGAASLSLAAVLSGLVGAPPLVVFASVAGTLYVWDTGQYAVELGNRVGRDADTGRAELSHVLAGLAVAALTTGVAYGALALTRQYSLAGSQQQLLLGLVFAAGGMIALLFSLRD